MGRTHVIKSWSSTRQSISLSSGEAEMVGVTKATAAALGLRSLLADFGVKCRARVWTDSSAAVGMCSRQGLGKVRHLDTQTMWVQQRVRCGDIDLYKIPGDDNPADIFTKSGIPVERMEKFVRELGCTWEDGRPTTAPALRKEGDTQVFGISKRAANARWSDCDSDSDALRAPLTREELEGVDRKLGLRPAPVAVPPALAETPEPVDNLVAEGEVLGRAGTGHAPLPERLQLRQPENH